ncbi:hypothetical protein VTN96DRAFT_1810 [Rasamsonia emersonii]
MGWKTWKSPFVGYPQSRLRRVSGRDNVPGFRNGAISEVGFYDSVGLDSMYNSVKSSSVEKTASRAQILLPDHALPARNPLLLPSMHSTYLLSSYVALFSRRTWSLLLLYCTQSAACCRLRVRSRSLLSPLGVHRSGDTIARLRWTGQNKQLTPAGGSDGGIGSLEPAP